MAAYETRIFQRKQLYDEIWTISTSKVSKKYNIPYQKLKAACIQYDIPLPNNAYWSNLAIGKPVLPSPLPEHTRSEIPLPCSTNSTQTTITPLIKNEPSTMPKNLHPQIIIYKKKIDAWKKNSPSEFGNRSKESLPLLWDKISLESYSRVYKLLSSIYYCLEGLGAKVNSDLSLTISGEHVTYEILESKDKVAHVLTREEKQAWESYHKRKNHASWDREPNTRKWDNIFNGNIRILINGSQSFRDTASAGLEARVDEIVSAFWMQADAVRVAREAAEAKKRDAEELARQKVLRQKQYDSEVDATLSLENEARDYAVACQIRTYIDAVCSQGDADDATADWVKWARDKADWYDPTVKKVDEFFGMRNHSASAENKKLTKYSPYRW